MMRRVVVPALALAVAAAPAMAATGPFVSLHNTNFIVLLAFILFVGILLYFRVPGMVAGMLDKRAEGIRTELAEARALREEAQALLASYERKQKDVAAQADRIVASARDEAMRAAAEAKEDIRTSVARRLAAAEEQIAGAEQAALRAVKDKAVGVAIAAAREVIADSMNASRANKLIDESIAIVEDKLH